MSRNLKMRKIKIVLCISFLIISILTGCGKQEPINALASIETSDIDKVEHTGTTGGKDGGFRILFQKVKTAVLSIC